MNPKDNGEKIESSIENTYHQSESSGYDLSPFIEDENVNVEENGSGNYDGYDQSVFEQ